MWMVYYLTHILIAPLGLSIVTWGLHGNAHGWWTWVSRKKVYSRIRWLTIRLGLRYRARVGYMLEMNSMDIYLGPLLVSCLRKMGLERFIVAKSPWASWSLAGYQVGLLLRRTRYVNHGHPKGHVHISSSLVSSWVVDLGRDSNCRIIFVQLHTTIMSGEVTDLKENQVNVM
jgi:hypothetical protein